MDYQRDTEVDQRLIYHVRPSNPALDIVIRKSGSPGWLWKKVVGMLKLKHSRRTFYLGSEDSMAIQQIKARYGCSTDSDCVRLALRLVAESPAAQLVKKKTK